MTYYCALLVGKLIIIFLLLNRSAAYKRWFLNDAPLVFRACKLFPLLFVSRGLKRLYKGLVDEGDVSIR